MNKTHRNSAPELIEHEPPITRARDWHWRHGGDDSLSSTLAKGLLILRAFIDTPRPLAHRELVERTGMSKATVSRLCSTLCAMGHLERDPRSERYMVGPSSVAMGYPYVVNAPGLNEGQGLMQALADEVGGAVSVGVAVRFEMIYLATCNSPGSTLARPAAGAKRSIMQTAMGRAWLSTLTTADLARALKALARLDAESYDRCHAAALDSLRHHSRRGFSVNLGDAGMGILGVGVASRLRQGQRRLIFNCACPPWKIKPADLKARIGPRLIAVVRQIEQSVGPRGAS